MLEFKFFVHLMDKFCQIRTIPGLANDRTLFLRFSRPRTSHAAFVGSDQCPHMTSRKKSMLPKYDMSLGKFQIDSGDTSLYLWGL
jgi:hypothetical protein